MASAQEVGEKVQVEETQAQDKLENLEYKNTSSETVKGEAKEKKAEIVVKEKQSNIEQGSEAEEEDPNKLECKSKSNSEASSDDGSKSGDDKSGDKDGTSSGDDKSSGTVKGKEDKKKKKLRKKKKKILSGGKSTASGSEKEDDEGSEKEGNEVKKEASGKSPEEKISKNNGEADESVKSDASDSGAKEKKGLLEKIMGKLPGYIKNGGESANN